MRKRRKIIKYCGLAREKMKRAMRSTLAMGSTGRRSIREGGRDVWISIDDKFISCKI